MDRSHATTIVDRPTPAANLQPATDAGDRPRQSCLTRGQRWLAGATALAVLLSGLNASVQVLKAVLDHQDQPGTQHPHPGTHRKLFHKGRLPATLRGPECAGRAMTVPGLDHQPEMFLLCSRYAVTFRP